MCVSLFLVIFFLQIVEIKYVYWQSKNISHGMHFFSF
jgi:hypothetical protein